MSRSLTQLSQNVLNLLNESADSTVADLDAGAGANATITTLATITSYLNDGAALLCRTCFALRGVGSRMLAVGDTNASLHGLPVTGGGTLWASRAATYNALPLTHMKRAMAELHFPSWLVDPNGVPLYWFEDGQQYIGVLPKPAAIAILQVSGLILPAMLGDGTGGTVTNVDWMPDDFAIVLQKYAASQVAEKNFEDATLFGRAAMYAEEFNIGCLRLWERIEPEIRAAHYPAPPSAIQSTPPQPQAGQAQ